MLNLIWGMDWTSNRKVLLKKLCAACSREKKQIWIVPEQASFEAERLLCTAGGNQISRFAEVLSFTRLANRVFSTCGGIARQTMDQGARVLAMAQALEQVRSRLKIYAAGSKKPAFWPQLLAAVDELKSYGIDTRQLSHTARLVGGSLAEKLEELSLILESYDTVCAGGAQDPNDRLAYLCQVLGNSDFACQHSFYLDGFTDFTGVELQIIRQLLQAGAEVTMCVCCDDPLQGQPVFDAPRQTVRALLQLADACKVKTYTLPAPQTEQTELHFAARELFTASAVTWPKAAQRIHLRSTQDVFEEAETVAAGILQCVRQGLRYRDMGIAAADYPACRTVYRAVFARYDIPVYFAGVEDILQQPLLDMLLLALEASAGSMERDTVLGWIKSGYAPLSEQECDQLENYVITWNISGARWQQDWRMHPAGYDAQWTPEDTAQLARLNEVKTRVLAPLLRLKADLAEAGTVGQMVKSLYGFLQQLQVAGQLEQSAQRMYETGALQQAQQMMQLYEILISALEQMYGLLEQSACSAEQFVQLLQVLLSQYHMGTIPAALDCVICGSVADLRYHTQPVLFLTGCSEGKLPALQAANSLFSEQERKILQANGLSLSPDAGGKLERELAGLYLVLQGAKEHLFCFASQEQPSYLFLRLQALFATRDDAYEQLQYPAPLARPDTLASAAVRQAAPAFITQAAALLPDALLQTQMDRLTSRSAYLPGNLRPDTVKALYGQKIFLSASQIQQFSACRQAHFLAYGIRAKQRLQAAFDAPIYGTFVHEVLEHTVRQVQQEGGFSQVPSQRVNEIAQSRIDAFTQAHFSDPQQQTDRFVYLYQRNFQEIMQVTVELEEELRHSAFVPERFELKFRPGTPMGPVEVHGKKGTALITGAVDRVDVYHTPEADYVRVVDYKTGYKDFDYTDLLSGMGLQMLIYLFALEENGQREFEKPLRPAGVLYFPARRNVLTLKAPVDAATAEQERIKDQKRKGLLLDEERLLQAMEPCTDSPRYLPYQVKNGTRVGDLADTYQLSLLRRHVRQTLQQITDELFSGNIAPNPYERGAQGACTYCPYADACHKDSTAPEVRKLRATKAEEFWNRLEQKEGGSHGEI